jgi:hypothetical protein
MKKQEKSSSYIDTSEDFLSTKMESSSGGMSIETKKLQFILLEKTEVDTNILLGSLGEGSLSTLATLHGKMSGMVMGSV